MGGFGHDGARGRGGVLWGAGCAACSTGAVSAHMANSPTLHTVPARPSAHAPYTLRTHAPHTRCTRAALTRRLAAWARLWQHALGLLAAAIFRPTPSPLPHCSLWRARNSRSHARTPHFSPSPTNAASTSPSRAASPRRSPPLSLPLPPLCTRAQPSGDALAAELAAEPVKPVAQLVARPALPRSSISATCGCGRRSQWERRAVGSCETISTLSM